MLRQCKDDLASASADSYHSGLLLGHVQLSEGEIAVHVEGFSMLPNVNLSADPPGLLVAVAERLRRQSEKQWPGLEIVGWFRSGPDLSFRASVEDALIHQALGDLGAAVFLALDSEAEQACYFFMNRGVMTQSSGYYLMDDAPTANDSSQLGECNDDHSGAVFMPSQHSSSFERHDQVPLEEAPVHRHVWPPRVEASPPYRQHSDVVRLLLIAVTVLTVAVLVLAVQSVSTHRTLTRLVAQNAPREVEALYTSEPSAAQSDAAQPQPQGEAAPPPEPMSEPEPAPKPIPTRPKVKPGTAGTVTVTVQPGDTVANIAVRLYGKVSKEQLQEILDMNGITDPSRLFPGRELVYPEPEQVPEP